MSIHPVLVLILGWCTWQYLRQQYQQTKRTVRRAKAKATPVKRTSTGIEIRTRPTPRPRGQR